MGLYCTLYSTYIDRQTMYSIIIHDCRYACVYHWRGFRCSFTNYFSLGSVLWGVSEGNSEACDVEEISYHSPFYVDI